MANPPPDSVPLTPYQPANGNTAAVIQSQPKNIPNVAFSQPNKTNEQTTFHQNFHVMASGDQAQGHVQYPPGYTPQQVISTQPQMGPGGQAPDGWMNIPIGVPANCPPGLEYLASIDQLLVNQQVEMVEVLIGFETANKYLIKNSVGQQVYYAAEDSDCCARNCCGPLRPFEMKILDNFGREVIHLSRPMNCQGCCCPCCLQSLEVYAPPGNLVGRIDEEWSFLQPLFSVKNAAGDTVLKIEGPICTMQLCSDRIFKVLSADGSNVVGKISKQWGGLLREMFTDADCFGITFPMDLDVNLKAVMMGALFLIDYMFFERNN
ncbi:phospholipid scramblase 2 isoform X2 [Nilaparvata lugens]|uniref:phospholipid scramblase 2 isoform X2 n=1 Tax=Nilaparvata lugens TaxID=108931 RepID=UPI00193C8EB7|nr:phospholipid scramblase 2 isoform X2 [Nilaparvata lugens]